VGRSSIGFLSRYLSGVPIVVSWRHLRVRGGLEAGSMRDDAGVEGRAATNGSTLVTITSAQARA
jgi:hypothetical protein